jgi:hypothetical protein
MVGHQHPVPGHHTIHGTLRGQQIAISGIAMIGENSF